MTTLREAAEQALEAMLKFPDDISDDMFESIIALKAALAKPDEVAAEREACARACSNMVRHGPVSEVQKRYNYAYADCAEAIRARGNDD